MAYTMQINDHRFSNRSILREIPQDQGTVGIVIHTAPNATISCQMMKKETSKTAPKPFKLKVVGSSPGWLVLPVTEYQVGTGNAKDRKKGFHRAHRFGSLIQRRPSIPTTLRRTATGQRLMKRLFRDFFE